MQSHVIFLLNLLFELLISSVLFDIYIYINSISFPPSVIPLQLFLHGFQIRFLEIRRLRVRVPSRTQIHFSEHLSLMNVTSHLFTNQARSPTFTCTLHTLLHIYMRLPPRQSICIGFEPNINVTFALPSESLQLSVRASLQKSEGCGFESRRGLRYIFLSI